MLLAVIACEDDADRSAHAAMICLPRCNGANGEAMLGNHQWTYSSGAGRHWHTHRASLNGYEEIVNNACDEV
jgi:hypothetical protein